MLTIGDDSSDEPMFEQVARLAENEPDTSAFSITVGKKPSAAQSYLDEPQDVFDLLNTLSRSAQRENRYFSSIDLPSAAKADALRQFEVTGKTPGSLAAKSTGGAHDIFNPPPKRDAFASTKRAPSLTPENRAMSVGNLSLSSHGGAEVSTAVNKKPGMCALTLRLILPCLATWKASMTTTMGTTVDSFSESVTLFFLSLSVKVIIVYTRHNCKKQ